MHKFIIAAYTSPAGRKENQDSYLISTKDIILIGKNEKEHHSSVSANLVTCVCDGVGGERCGKQASEFVTEYLGHAVVNENNLADKVEEIHTALTKDESLGLTTIVAACINERERTITMVSCGDSRIYLLRNESIRLLTRDDSTAPILMEIFRNLTENEAHSLALLTDCMGYEHFRLTTRYEPLIEGDMLILMSDGAYLLFDEWDEIEKKKHPDEIVDVVKERIGEADDNVTVVAVKFDAVILESYDSETRDNIKNIRFFLGNTDRGEKYIELNNEYPYHNLLIYGGIGSGSMQVLHNVISEILNVSSYVNMKILSHDVSFEQYRNRCGVEIANNPKMYFEQIFHILEERYEQFREMKLHSYYDLPAHIKLDRFMLVVSNFDEVMNNAQEEIRYMIRWIAKAGMKVGIFMVAECTTLNEPMEEPLQYFRKAVLMKNNGHWKEHNLAELSRGEALLHDAYCEHYEKVQFI